MKMNQSGFTLGALIKIIAVLAIAVATAIWYNNYQLKSQVEQVELILVDAKERLENSLSLDDDKNITYGDAITKTDEAAKKIDESIIQLKKIDNAKLKEHQDKGLRILMASRDLMRIQSRIIRIHAELTSNMTRVQDMIDDDGESSLSSYKLATLTHVKGDLSRLSTEADEMGDRRILALTSLTAATIDSGQLFQSKALIDVDRYLAATKKLQEMKDGKN